MGILLFASNMSNTSAQDAQFSQFYASPVYLNPAMIGFSEAPRFNINFRDQLPSFSNAFITTALSFDQHFHSINSSLGLNLVADMAGGLLNTYQLNGVYAYNLPLGRGMSFKAGLQFGVIQQSVNLNNIVFGDMINPNDLAENYNLPTSELPLQTTSLTKFDVGAGFLMYSETFFAGASFKHLTQPEFSFTTLEDTDNNLPIMTSVHIGKTFLLNDPFFEKNQWYVVPNLLFAHQKNFMQVNAGAYLGYGAIHGGLWVRHAVRNSDALIAMVGFKKGIFRIGYSYDFDLGKVKTAAGAHEISLGFDLGQDAYNKRKVRMREQINCPTMFK